MGHTLTCDCGCGTSQAVDDDGLRLASPPGWLRVSRVGVQRLGEPSSWIVAGWPCLERLAIRQVTSGRI